MRPLSITFQKFGALVDKLNDKFTSYRLVLYFLILLVAWAVIGSFFDKVPYSAAEIISSAGWLVLICWLSNKLIARFLDIPANKESHMITALILALILTPPKYSLDFAILGAVALGAIASKYVIGYNRSHVFNPAAAGAFIAGEVFSKYPSWWIGTKFMTPLVAIGGLFVLRKMKRFTMVAVFLATFILYLIYGTSSGSDVHFLWLELISTQILFFAIIMLTEPLTSPAAISRYLPYAVLVGVLYSVARLGLSPEQALLIGNLFTFIFAHNRRYLLKFIGSKKEAEGIFSYGFSLPNGFKFKAGQYLEWTIARNKTDSRGNRRYLTIASSPTEPGLIISVKQPPKASAFKHQLNQLKPGDSIIASHLSGSFTLPEDNSKKLVFMAGGIGATPFRSMARYMIDSKQKRDAILVYSAASAGELAFQNIFNKASAVGLKSHYLTDGQVDQAMVEKLVPDFKDRRFYVSGPYGYVNAIHSALLGLGVSSGDIITDYFPGYG